MDAEKHHSDTHIQMSEANVQSTIRWQRHHDDLAMLSQKRGANLSHNQQTHQQRLDQRRDKTALDHADKDLRHARSLAHMRDAHGQRWQEREDRRMIQEYELMWRKKQLEKEAGRERHGMKMTELRTQRGNIIGQVNLEELRRWQEGERKMMSSLGQVQVQGRMLK
jgi:hypothetical protein